VLDFEKNDDHLVNHLVLCSNKLCAENTLIAFIITEHVVQLSGPVNQIKTYFLFCSILFCSFLFHSVLKVVYELAYRA